MEKVLFDSDNLMYNRFDIIYEEAMDFTQEFEGKEYSVLVHCENGMAKINTWGKSIPGQVMKNIVSGIFENQRVFCIEVTRTDNNFEKFLYEQNDFRVPLPNSVEELLSRVERRDRATIRRKKRWLDERVGTINIEHYSEDIPTEIVDTYFIWKKSSHGTDYKLSSKEYLEKYYVTDALVLLAGGTAIGIAFYCKCEDIVYFENFSYNSAYREYSPGLLMYEVLLEHLIERKCRYLYMAGGNYIYKRRFGSEENKCFSGQIYREEVLLQLSALFSDNKISGDIAIYGYGRYGHIYKPILDKMGVNVLYAIDRNEECDGDLDIRNPDSDLSDVSKILITLKEHNDEIERLLITKGKEVFYMTDLIHQAEKNYLKSEICLRS